MPDEYRTSHPDDAGAVPRLAAGRAAGAGREPGRRPGREHLPDGDEHPGPDAQLRAADHPGRAGHRGDARLLAATGRGVRQADDRLRRGERAMTTAVVVYAGLILARIAAFVGVMPVFATRTPLLVRTGLVIALTAFYVGSVTPDWNPALAARASEVHPIRYAVALVREALIGAAMGFAFGLFLLPARVAGEFVTLQVGLNVAPQVGP